MQKQVLERQPSPDLRVYAVWFSMVPGDERSSWPRGLLEDPRVIELWDEERILGRWLAEQPDFRTRGLVGGGVMWDTYLLFAPDSVWDDRPTGLASAGHTIIAARDRLARDLIPLLRGP